MSELKSLQRQLAAEILDAAAGRAQRSDDLADGLRLPAGIDSDSRLAVYRDGYPARIFEALQNAYPAVANICGDGSFADLAQRYVRENDVTAVSLNQIGGQLPQHCQHDPLAAALPFLADLAELERAALHALHSADSAPVDPAVFGAWNMDDWERVVLRFQPSAQVVRSRWPIHDLWAARDTPRDEIDIAIDGRPQDVLVYRRGYEVECRSLPAVEAVALVSLMAAAPLGEAMQSVTDAGAAGTDVSQIFAGWLGAGLIAGARLT
jgi:hypothetical protein